MIIPIKQIILEMYEDIPEAFHHTEYEPNSKSNWAMSQKDYDTSLSKSHQYLNSPTKQAFNDRLYLQNKYEMLPDDTKPEYYKDYSKIGLNDIHQLGKANDRMIQHYHAEYNDPEKVKQLRHIDTTNRSYIEADKYLNHQPKGIQASINKALNIGNKNLNINIDKTKSPLYNIMYNETRPKLEQFTKY